MGSRVKFCPHWSKNATGYTTLDVNYCRAHKEGGDGGLSTHLT